jgi:hypothetical protein
MLGRRMFPSYRNNMLNRERKLVGFSETLPKTSQFLCACATPDWTTFRGVVLRSPTFPFFGRRTEEYGLSDREPTDAGDRAVDPRVVVVRTNDRFQHFWGGTC